MLPSPTRLALAAGLFVSTCQLAYAQQAPICLPYRDFSKALEDNHAERRAGIGLLRDGMGVIELWVGEETWTILVIRTDGIACGVAVGGHWIPVFRDEARSEA